MRRKNIYKSAIAGLLEEGIAVICGFILPRMILSYFGSDYNGIIASVTQFIGCIALLKSGIGMATKAALYEPLYNNDNKRISEIMAATTKFLRKVAFIFVLGIIIFACVYPMFVKESFDCGFTASLFLIISLGTFFQYYFGLSNQLLLEADQKYYIVSIITIVNIVFNTIISVICMKLGMSIHGMKLCSSVVYCSTPIALNYYVYKKYNLDKKVEPDWMSISKRWDAFGMQLANFINDNTDIIVATLFLNMKEVSVYTIYYLVINGIKKIIFRISKGVESALGNLKAEKNEIKLREIFKDFEFVLNGICTFVFSCLITLIVPFVGVYTKGVTDVNYTRYVFAFVACCAELFYCLRLAYTFMVQAVGAFSETKKYFYIEAIINIISSVILVKFMGLVGIVVGTLIAMIYRTYIFAYYVYNEILKISFTGFYKSIVITIGGVFTNGIIGMFIMSSVDVNNYLQWFGVALLVALVDLIITILIYYICNAEFFFFFLKLLVRRVKNV